MRLHTTRHSRIHTHPDHVVEVDAAGPYACTDCAYVVTAYRQMPACPMCGSASWSAVAARLLHPRQAPRKAASEGEGEPRAA